VKFLIDECLSAELVGLAHAHGHDESSHVVWIGKAGLKDWSLLPVILDGDWTFVTRNAYDFRGPPEAPGSKGQYAKTTLHAGLVCLNGPPGGFDLGAQRELFAIALGEIDREPDLTNQVLEITLETALHKQIAIRRYELPA
jgi:Domain of unknown function (DUF5615)